MSLLEQAIVDAQELKEAALKSAESSILEKYSADIREAVDSMLGQEEEEDPMADMMGGMPEEEELPEEGIPYAAMQRLSFALVQMMKRRLQFRLISYKPWQDSWVTKEALQNQKKHWQWQWGQKRKTRKKFL